MTLFRTPKLSHSVAEHFRARIAAGELKPGDTLPPESELLARLQVSRPTLREALRVLESEQLIQLGRGARGGAIVLQPSIETAAQYGSLYLATRATTLGQIHEVRRILEPPIAGQLAAASDGDVIRSLQECVQMQQSALRAGNYVGAAIGVNEFHGRLVRATDNAALALLAGMLQNIATRVYPKIPLAGRNAADRTKVLKRSEESTEAHASLVRLIAQGKATDAERYWRRYMSDTAAFLADFGMTEIGLQEPVTTLAAGAASRAAP